MAKPTSQDRRKQLLKQRQAELRREMDSEEAHLLFASAAEANRRGDDPSAARMLKRVMSLDPNHTDALILLAQIHDSAGHYAEALAYLRQARKLKHDPSVLYNIGVVHRQMMQPALAAAAMREFLEATKGQRESKILQLRQSAKALCESLPPETVAKPAAPAAKPQTLAQTTPPATPKPERSPEVPRVGVQFFPPAASDFTNAGTLADYF